MEKFISLCMIVKNEEKVIERCLSSVASLVDEIIVVDTGSTDQTKELVSKYTSNIYDFAWIDDFSAARNYASSKATGEWILVLDADEYIDEENFKAFVEEIKADQNQYNSYTAKILNFTGNNGESLIQNYHDRIYKNHSHIKYYRKIHEQFQHELGEPLRIKNSSLLIFHSGYLTSTVNEKDKTSRNRELIDQEIETGQNQAFDYFNIGNEYFSMSEYGRAFDSYLEAYKLKTDFRLTWVSTTVIQMIICLINTERYSDAMLVIKEAEQLYTKSPEIKYLKAELFLQRGQLEDAEQEFLHLVNNSDLFDGIIIRPDLKDQKPHLRLGDIYLIKEDYNNAIFHYTSLLNINKYNNEGINKVISLLSKFHSVEQISDFINSKGLVNAKNIQQYVSASLAVGNPKLAQSLLEFYFEDNQLLYKISLLKKFTIENDGDLKDFSDIFKSDLMNSLYEAGWINFIDIYILKKYNDKNFESALIDITNNIQMNTLFRFFDNELNINEIDEDLIASSLQIALTYKNDELCNAILEEIEKAEPGTIRIVARMLYTHKFKVEGLQLYDLCDWSYFEAQDFIIVIESLLETNNIEAALEIAKYSIARFEGNFRFYKYLIENSKDIEIIKSTVIHAKEIFKGSNYLNQYMF